MIEDLKTRFEEYLLDNGIEDSPQSLFDPINYIMSTGGKRFRPLLCMLLSCNESDDVTDEALLLAHTIELFHNFTLVHDDIMDEADVRRGSATVHKKYSVPKAILSGDAMLILCFDKLTQMDERNRTLLLNEFIKTALDVCKGQELDMKFEQLNNVSYEDYIEMVRLKTGTLIGLSLFTGGILGGLSYEESRLLQEAGEQVGIAFQVKDDFLDVYGDSNETGKIEGGDILNGKKTLLYYYATALAEADDRDELIAIYTKAEVRNEEDIKRVKEIYDAAGVPDLLEEEMEKYNSMSTALVDKVQLRKKIRQELGLLLPMLTDRNL